MNAMPPIKAAADPKISEADYVKFCDYFYRQTGI